ncbi:MAG: hypothetical protein P8166_16670 [Candidatus Thiodiazotropha sp.]
MTLLVGYLTTYSKRFRSTARTGTNWRPTANIQLSRKLPTDRV